MADETDPADPDPDPDRIDYDALAENVLARLDPGSVVGDRVILSRRQAIALGTGATSLAALGLFSGTASADVVGQVGTQQDRVDVFGGEVDANSVSTDQVAVTELGAMVVGDGNKQTISPGSNVTLTNVATRFEDTTIVSVDTTTGIATVQKDGTYAVSGLAHWDSDPGWSAGDGATIRIRAPTTPVENQANHTGIDIVEARPLPLAQVQLSANDEIKLECFNGSGANKRVLGVARKLTLSIWRVRA